MVLTCWIVSSPYFYYYGIIDNITVLQLRLSLWVLVPNDSICFILMGSHLSPVWSINPIKKLFLKISHPIWHYSEATNGRMPSKHPLKISWTSTYPTNPLSTSLICRFIVNLFLHPCRKPSIITWHFTHSEYPYLFRLSIYTTKILWRPYIHARYTTARSLSLWLLLS